MRMLLRAMRNARHPLGMALYIAVMRYLLQQIAQEQSQQASHELSRKEKVHAAISSWLGRRFHNCQSNRSECRDGYYDLTGLPAPRDPAAGKGSGISAPHGSQSGHECAGRSL